MTTVLSAAFDDQTVRPSQTIFMWPAVIEYRPPLDAFTIPFIPDASENAHEMDVRAPYVVRKRWMSDDWEYTCVTHSIISTVNVRTRGAIGNLEE